MCGYKCEHGARGQYQRTFWLNAGNDTVSTPQEQYGGILNFLSDAFLSSKNRSPFTSIVFDLAATLFTPESPKVFCGLKHFTHPSIGIVESS